MGEMKIAQPVRGNELPVNTLINDLTTGNVSRKLIQFSALFILANLLQVFYNLTDMVFVGHYLDSAATSAVANGGDIMNLITSFGIGLSTASQVLIAQLVGNKLTEGIKKAIGTSFCFMGILAIVLMILSYAMLDWLTTAVNVPLEARDAIKTYCMVSFTGMFFVFGYNAISGILRGMGDSKRPLIIIAIATLLNFVLDFLLIREMGIKGVAIATVIAQGTSFFVSLIYLYIKRQAFGFDFRLGSFVIEQESLVFLLKLGLPLALLGGSVTISKLFVSSWVNSYGLAISAVNGIGTKLGQIASIVTSAFSTASATMIGQCFGAGKFTRINKIVYISLGWGLLYTVILSTLLLLFSEQTFRLFTKDSQVLTLSHQYIIIAMLNFNAFALRSPMMALIQGLGNGRLLIIIGILDGVVVRIGLALLMGLTFGLGIMGFWYGSVFASYVPFLIGGIYYWSGVWKNRIMSTNI